MFLLSVENTVLLQYYSRLQYNQSLDLFFIIVLHHQWLEGRFYETVSIQNCQGSQVQDIITPIYSSRMLQRRDSWLVQRTDKTQLLSPS